MSRAETRRRLREDALGALETGLQAVDPRRAVASALSREALSGPVRVLALGKAAPAMVAGAREVLGDLLRGGVAVSVAAGPDDGCIEWLAGGHPLPDERSERAGRRLLAEARSLREDETALVLISGGASALAGSPRPGASLDELRRVTQELLRSGAPIERINETRSSLSAVAAGGLGEAIGGRPARTLVVSDVPGDDPHLVGSGPMADGGHPGLAARQVELVACGADAAAAAGTRLAEQGYLVEVVPEPLVGEAAREASRALGRLAAAGRGARALVLAGEPVVRVTGEAEGGRCRHAALAAALELERRGASPRELVFAALATDGRDGSGASAGAVVDGLSAERIRGAGRAPERDLAGRASGAALAVSGDSLPARDTGTNVADLWVLLAEESRPVLAPLEQVPGLSLVADERPLLASLALTDLARALRLAVKSLAAPAVLAVEGAWDPSRAGRDAGDAVRIRPAGPEARKALTDAGLVENPPGTGLWRLEGAARGPRRPGWAS